jgi:flagellar protein FlgJ
LTTVEARGSLPTVSMPAASTVVNPGASQSGFVSQHTAAAERVAQATGIPAAFMVGQAGHETGWGRSEIRNADGSTSHNLFGIKAGAGWTGKVATITTTEYVDGEPRKVQANFRAYDSYEASFRDYARLIGESPRYAQAKAVAAGATAGAGTAAASAYASELQQAGYATDPAYAAKLSRAINSTLMLQRAQQV